jgi:phosphomannomutase
VTSSLRCSLTYEPRELNFGTSGRRGLVQDLTQLEIYMNVRGELSYLQQLAPGDGGIAPGDDFYYAFDLRPSAGSLCHAVERAARDAGMKPVSMGAIPTPALTAWALSRGKGSIMVTGSHIPFDRNGYKLNTSRGELLKHQEDPINEAVRLVRAKVYDSPMAQSPFSERGALRDPGQLVLPSGEARAFYLRRYRDFFTPGALSGLRILYYEHSAVGRELVPEILEALGAQVVRTGRSETFVPIDTENIDAAQLACIQRLLDASGSGFDAVISTDGDSDRPLILGVEPSGKVRFFGGDLVGMIVAQYLGADAVVVPISCNDGIDRGPLARVLEPKTRIGSPYVIAGMEAARLRGCKAVCGWEANGGFLTGSDLERKGRILPALPTRDAVLPILAVLSAARERGIAPGSLFEELPRRFSKAALIQRFPRAAALEIVARFSPPRDAAGISADLERYFTPARGFGRVLHVDYTDGVRVLSEHDEVAHFRPSGNADEFRIYGCAATEERASEIAALGVADGGILRQMEADL